MSDDALTSALGKVTTHLESRWGIPLAIGDAIPIIEMYRILRAMFGNAELALDYVRWCANR